ncbi:MAG TPA: DNA repair and recombination protein RadA [Candidatus Lokiarchaeia archaeon]|nr:DNA repair and recombination protein RadA [Candidatus Lokiarchaeia archaeon]
MAKKSSKSKSASAIAIEDEEPAKTKASNGTKIDNEEIDRAFEEAMKEGSTSAKAKKSRDEVSDDDVDIDIDAAIEASGGQVDLDKLTVKDIPGVGPSIAKKLIDSGFSNIRAIATLPPKMLMAESGIGDKSAEKIVKAAQELCKMEFVTADVVFEKRQHLGKIVTGSNALNEILGGGVETGAITELVGEFRTGKTQIAHQCCINVQLPPDQGGLSGRALYVDTEGTFRPERLAKMAMAKGMDVTEALKNVIYARAYNSEHQINILRQARKLIEKQNVKLIVVDSLISHFRSEYFGLGSLGPRQQLLNMHIHQIQQLADTYYIAAIVTNQVQAKPDVFFGNPTIPAGGNIVAHGSTYRVFLRKAKGDTRVAKIIDAPGLPEAEAAFRITDKGVEDAEE